MVVSQITAVPERPVAERLAAVEYGRFGELLHTLRGEEWTRPTDCPAWDVRLLAAHVVGATEANASPLEMVRQVWHGLTRHGIGVDAVSGAQVRRRATLTPAELVRRLDAAAPRAVRQRARYARYAGPVPFPVGAPVFEHWPLGFLAGVVYTRDVWMHRIDVCRATGREPVLTADHDGRIVADAVEEWLRRHGRPVALTLTGTAGGRWSQRPAGQPETYEAACDAVEFCRRLSGRGEPPLGTPVPF